jgi:hypothetical protein
LGDDQLLHLPLYQLPLPGRQLSLLVSQPSIPGIRVELTGQDLGTDVLQCLLLSLEVETMLSGPLCCPLGHCHPLEHACPQLEVVALVSKVLTFAV